MKINLSCFAVWPIVGLGLFLFANLGCEQPPSDMPPSAMKMVPPDSPATSDPATQESADTHAPHADELSHDHNELIELGDDEYHARVVHDEATGSITIHLLDSSAKKLAPVDAKELIVNVSFDGQAKQFALAQDPDEKDLPGTASRFTSQDQELAKVLVREDAESHLVITIDDKQFRGPIAPNRVHDSE